MRKEREKREKILTIATGYPGVQTFPTPSPPRLFISEREVGAGKARKAYFAYLSPIKRKEKREKRH